MRLLLAFVAGLIALACFAGFSSVEAKRRHHAAAVALSHRRAAAIARHRASANDTLVAHGKGKRNPMGRLSNAELDHILSLSSPQVNATKYLHTVYGLAKPRLQWLENYGYCGEASFIHAGLTMGGFYSSQFDMRAIAAGYSGGDDQKSEDSQLLIGVNDEETADYHLFNEVSWDEDIIDSEAFIVWLKQHILQDHLIVIGIFQNEYVFGPPEDDPDYDHIVLVTGWGSNHPLTDFSYYSDDVVYFSDNGVYDGVSRATGRGSRRHAGGGVTVGKEPQYEFAIPLSSFLQSRSSANTKSAPVYSLNKSPSKSHPNYAISLLSELDDDGLLLPLFIDTDRNDESPDIKEGSNTRPSSMDVTLTIRVESLIAGRTYNLYRYDSFSKVGTRNWNANKKNAVATTTFTATSETWTTTLDWTSNKRAIFRCVMSTSP